MREGAKRHIVGGSIYDALIAHCALKASVDEIFTWNVRHYQLLGEEVVKRVRMPTP